MDRRKFVQTLTGLSLAAVAGGNLAFARDSRARLKIVVFREENFPAIDGLNLSKNVLQEALSAHDTVFAGTRDLEKELSAAAGADLLINPYGSAFPKAAWTTILRYLQTGGNFLNLGGVPFAVPVRDSKAETRQVNFHKRIGILQAFEIAGSAAPKYRSNIEELQNFAAAAQVEKTFALYPRLTTKVDFPEDSGSDGAREAVTSALVHGLDANGRARCAPIVAFDRLKGEFAGGRWVFALYKGAIDARAIRLLAETAAFGAVEFSVKTDSASYRASEKPKLEIFADNPKLKNEIWTNGLSIEVFDAENNSFFSSALKIEKKAGQPLGVEIALDQKAFRTGFYRVRVAANLAKKNGLIETHARETGFWFAGEKLLETGGEFTADRHFLYRGGEPFPVAGVTYMASDVHRRFLLEPNPAVWDADFAAMKAAGVNMIRTGIWTGWKLYTDERGNVREEILRAFEAFLLTAKKYDVPVIFTFFAFMPEMFGGRNAYLDPQAIEGQKRFLRAFAARARAAKDIVWDLINEPSFANPKALWSCRPNGDEFEKAAWKAWLKKRFAERDEKILADILREKWRLAGEENPFELPRAEDFDAVNIFSSRRPLKTLDFRLFAQDTFTDWARAMSKELKTSGSAVQMVTVGQDEAGLNDSPAQQFHAAALDLTGLHNWWSNDDLLWDNVASKAPAKPNLVQETGVMFYEKTDGAAWREEATVAELLERKMAFALGANACGFIEWVWNTNPFMNIDNEAGIGFWRVDGTAKPELEPFLEIARFANENRRYFRAPQDEKTLLVIPHSYQFTPRNFAWEAAKKAVRAFHNHCRRSLRAASEYDLETILAEAGAPALIIVPSARVLTDAAWENLLRLARKGATVALTGYIEENEYQQMRKRLGAYFPFAGAKPVAQFETAQIGGRDFQIRYAGEKIQRVEKANFSAPAIQETRIGAGALLWSPLPLEIGETLEAVAAFYELAARRAAILPVFSLKTDNPAILIRPTEFADTVLYLAVNESASDERIELTHSPTATKIEFLLPGGRANLIFVDRRTGKVLSRLR